MSHIHEALKKAQKERDVRSLRYSGILASSERKKRILSRKTIQWAFPLIIVIFLAFFYDSWLDFTSSKTPEPSEKDQQRGQSAPKGTGPAKSLETAPKRTRDVGLKKQQDNALEKHRTIGPKKRQENVQEESGEFDLRNQQVIALSKPKEPVRVKRQGTESGKPEDIYNRARRYHKGGRLEEAKRLYEETLRLDPGYVDALNNLGVIFIRKREYLAAQLNLEKAVRLRPDNAEPFYNLACLNAIRGETKLALAQLKKAVSLDPAVKDWARKDTDLENLQHLPEFKELI